jgi:hypothetical protein
MERLDAGANGVEVVLSRAELLILNNALNEACNGVAIEESEFSTRLGAERSEAKRLLADLGDVIDSLAPDG